MTAMHRRRLVATLGGAGVGLLAGCLGRRDDDPSDDGESPDDDSRRTDTDAAADGPGSGGLVYGFRPDSIELFDPEAGEVVETVADGLGNRTWGDVRYNEATDRLFAVDGRLGDVLVVDTQSRSLDTTVPVGGSPVHAAIPVPEELWVHADDEAALYVIDTESLQGIGTVQAGPTDGGHGKLSFHPDLQPSAFATNVTEPTVFEVDTAAYERVSQIAVDADHGAGDHSDGHGSDDGHTHDHSRSQAVDFEYEPLHGDDGHDHDDGNGHDHGAGGTHSIQYSPANDLLYVEVQGYGTVAVDPTSGDHGDRIAEAGGLAISPDDRYLGLWTDHELHVFDVTSPDSDHLSSAEIPHGGPDDLLFFDVEDEPVAFTPTADGVTAIDIDDGTVLGSVSAGAFDADAPFASRSIARTDESVLVTADLDGTVTVVDPISLERRDDIQVGEGIETLSYIPAY